MTLLPTAALWARVELRSVSASGSTVVFSFSELPRTAIPELSADKTRILLRIPDAFASEQARDGVKANDNIELVSMQQKGSELAIYVVLRKKAGCTQVLLPYSRTLRLHIVDWDKIPARDNLYHSGLLSLDSGVPATAQTSFKRAANAGSGDAAAMMGLTLITEGNVDEAERELRRATDLSTSLPDVYAALADIASYHNDTARVRQYADQFRKKSGIDSFPSMLDHLPKEAATPAEPQTFAQSLLTGEAQDTVPHISTADTARGDSSLNAAVSQQAQALVSDTTASTPYTGESLVPSWMKWTVLGFLFFIGTGIVGIVYLYMRWRKKQLQQAAPTATQAQTSFESEVNTALQSAGARRAADLYNRSSGEEPDNEKAGSEPEADNEPEADIPQPHSEVPQRHWMDEISEPPPIPPVAQPQIAETQASDDVDALAKKLRRGRGELELAVKLLARKKQDGREKADTLDPEQIPERPAQLARLAGTLGIGTGELEIRRNLGSVEEGERAEKMRSLFGQGPKANN